MSLQGKLEEISIGEIIQALTLNEHEGTLRIRPVPAPSTSADSPRTQHQRRAGAGPSGARASSGADARTGASATGAGLSSSAAIGGSGDKIFYLSKGEITLIVPGRRALRLGEALIKSEKITSAQLEAALGDHEKSGRVIGRALVEMGAVTEADIERIVQNQFREEFFEIFLIERGTFEFLFDVKPEALVTLDDTFSRVHLNTSNLMLEALRQIDEWREMAKVIPTPRAIFTLERNSLTLEGQLGDASPDALRSLSLIDGARPLSEVCAESVANKFDVYALVCELVKAGAVRPLTKEECSEGATHSETKSDLRTAAGFYEFALYLDPEDRLLQERYFLLLKKSQRYAEAKDLALKLADRHLRKSRFEAALEYYLEAQAIEPKDLVALEGIFRCYARVDRKGARAIRTGEDLVRAARREHDQPRVRAALEEMLALEPEAPERRLELVDALVDLRDRPEALKHCAIAIDQLEARADPAAAPILLEAYRKVLAIDERREDVRAKLNVVAAAEEEIERVAETRRRIAVAVVVVAALVAIPYFLFVTVARLARTDAGEGDLVAEAPGDAGSREGRVLGAGAAAKAGAGVAGTGSGSVGAENVSVPDGRMSGSHVTPGAGGRGVGETPPEVEGPGEPKGTAASGGGGNGSGGAAGSGDGGGAGSGTVAAGAGGAVGSNGSTPSGAGEGALGLLRQARALEKRGAYRAAAELYFLILAEYPEVGRDQRILIPVPVSTVPPGARIYFEGAATPLPEATPTVLLSAPGEDLVVRLEASGFRPAVERLKVDRYREIDVTLTRAPVWTFAAPDTVHQTPAPAGDVVLFAAKSGEAVAVDAATGALVWRVRLVRAGEDVSGPAIVAPGVGPEGAPAGPAAVFATTEGDVHAIDAATGRTLWTYAQAGAVFREAPTASPEGRTVVVPSSDGSGHAIDAATGAGLARVEVGRPAGAPLALAALAAPPSEGASGAELLAFVPGRDRSLAAVTFAPGGRAVRWVAELSAPIRARPLVVHEPADAAAATPPAVEGGGTATAPAGPAAPGASVAPGAPGAPSAPGASETPGTPGTPAEARGALVIAAGSDGWVRAFAAEDGSPRWQYAAGAPVSAAPALSPDHALVVVACEDATIHALEPATGRRRFRSELAKAGPIQAAPVFDTRGTLLLVSARKAFVAVDARTGGERWRVDLADAPGLAGPAVGGGHVYAVSGQNVVAFRE